MNQKGFALLEVLVVLAVGTVILFPVVSSLFMTMRGVPDIREKTLVLADIDRAAYWLNRDIVMGKTSNLVDAAPPVDQMTITWIDYTKAAEIEEDQFHSVSYTWSPGTGELQRNYDGVITVVGVNLTNVGFSRNDRSVTVTLTSFIDEESSSTVTRAYTILMRPEDAV
ncbi:prepilin-type N-terminal cleavage/methylation domain-containing protein [Chloroflexota bacterium]